MINEYDLKLLLLSGLPIEIKGIGKIHQLKLKDLAIMGESKYNYHLTLLCLDEISAKKNEIDIHGLTVLEYMWLNCYHDKRFKDDFLEAISLYFNEQVKMHEDGFFYLGDESENRFITNTNYSEVQSIIKKINCVKVESNEEEFNPANEKARELIEKIKQNRKNKPIPKANIDTASMVSGISWKSNNVNILNVWDLTIYQLHDGYFRLEVIDNYQYTLTGIYAGTIDGKKIDFKQITWAKIVED